MPGTPPRLTLAPGEISKVRFASTTIKADAPLPDLNAPLRVEVRNAADPQTVLGQATIDTRVAEPTEYIHVSHVEYAPSSAGNPAGNQLSVSLGASPDLAGPPVVAQLVLPPDQIPGFLGVGDGTVRASLPQGGADATLFVKNLRRRPEEQQGGTFYVQVDSYPRGIAFRASFPPDGQPTLPLEDARPALRLRAASTSPAIPNFPVRVEVDRPLPGSSLEIGLGRVRAGVFEPEIIRKFSSPQDRRIGFAPGGPDGSLLFEASAKDWSVPLDLSGTEGARILRARLLDENGQEIRSAMQPLMIDDQAPAGPTFLGVPAQARKGSKLTVRATAGATQSGIKAARFFVGSPPASGAPLPATQATTLGGPDSGGEIWSAELTLPATPGPATLSAQFESGAGQFAYASTGIELTETDPITPGQIQGRVLEGPRPQPGLVVRLTQPPKDPSSPDAQPKSAPAQKAQEPTEIAKTTTEADGTFRFENVAPGSYTLNTRKEASLTKAKADVTVKPNVISQVTLELFR